MTKAERMRDRPARKAAAKLRWQAKKRNARDEAGLKPGTEECTAWSRAYDKKHPCP